MKVATNTARILRNVPLPDEVAVTHNNAVIIDMGGYSTRIGYAGDNAPRMNERTAVLLGESEEGTKTKNLCFNKAYESVDHTHVTGVIRNGLVTNWDACEQLLQHIDDVMLLSDMDVNSPVMMTEKALVPHTQRQKIAELLFEKHHVSSAFFSLSPVLALYASGICTGVSVEMSHDQSHVVPVFQGFPHFHAMHCLPVGGRDLTEVLQQRCPQSLPPSVLARSEADTWGFLKEVCCYTAENKIAFSVSLANATADKYAMSHRLPDGTTMTLGAERFVPSEIFIQPAALMPNLRCAQAEVESEVLLRSFSGSVKGIQELIVDATKKCDHDLASTFLDNILLSGGSSLFKGFPDRLESEVQALLPVSADRVRVIAEVERRGAAFVGASILASLPSFQNLWVTRKEYEEFGSVAVVRGGFNA